MKIDFVSDIACPWCAVGLNSLEQALQRLGADVTVELHFQPFELNPAMPPEGEEIVERAIEKYGAPVYVRHEIVHNRHVVERLKAMGAVFVKELDDCPDDRPVVFSAHGVPKSVPATAKAREMLFLDATCPLVSKVHVEAERHHAAGRHIVLIGHAGHPEVVGTMGQLPPGAISLVETVLDGLAAHLERHLDVDRLWQIAARVRS
jgi:(E)-4-hydroxy-3-methyl-but-2-enyl pyrophosphate reductase